MVNNIICKGGNMLSKYEALTIAKWFIIRDNKEESEKITLTKLLNLLYYAEGCSLALENGSLFPEKIMAWEYGAVVTEVYYSFPDPYNLQIEEQDTDCLQIEKQDVDCLEQVFEVFGSYAAWALKNKTREEVPWKNATDNGRKLGNEISRDTIKQYFKENYIKE